MGDKMKSILNVKIGSFDIRKMITYIFWLGLIYVVITHFVFNYGIFWGSKIIYSITQNGPEVFRTENVVDVFNSKHFIYNFAIAFFEVVIWRFICEIMYIILKGFEGLHKSNNLE